jgi:glycosyltransferase involved in cell wall biosynthesis
MIVGDGDVVVQLKEYVHEHLLSANVLFFDRKPYQEMMNYTFHADIGLTLDKPTNLNYRYSLPNKVFDYIHAGTPIIATDLVEISDIIQRYDVGRIITDFTPQNLAKMISSLLADSPLLDQLKANCLKTKEIENWEKETELLKEIYPKIV